VTGEDIYTVQYSVDCMSHLDVNWRRRIEEYGCLMSWLGSLKVLYVQNHWYNSSKIARKLFLR
jgi:hypothetical protein